MLRESREAETGCVLPGRRDPGGPVLQPLLLALANEEGGGAAGGFRTARSPRRTSLAVLPEHPDVSAESLQKDGDVNLLQRFFTVVDGHQDVQRADAVGLLQTAEDAC